MADAVPFDLLIKGGHVIDPSSRVAGEFDIAIKGSRIAEVAPRIEAGLAYEVIDARSRIVTPGLIDIHVHVFDSFTSLGVPADPNCVAKGVTTVLDAGTAGAMTFPAFRRHVIDVSATRVRALLNVARTGMASNSPSDSDNLCELADIRNLSTGQAIRTIEANRDSIMGVKIRLMPDTEAGRDFEALDLARTIADTVRLPLMVHYVGRPWPLGKVLERLSPGDVVTHSFHAHENGIMDDDGRVLASVRSATEAGIIFDVGHGEGCFSFAVAEAALAQEFLPATISSDLHRYNVLGPVFDLPTTMSKFLALGVALERVIAMTTAMPAKVFAFPTGTGSLGVGADADIAIFELLEGRFRFADALGATRDGNQRLLPTATVRAGHVYGAGARVDIG